MKSRDVNYYELFIEIDKNNKGNVTKQELKQWLDKTLNLEFSRQKMENLMNYFDSDHDGSISTTELKKKLTRSSGK